MEKKLIIKILVILILFTFPILLKGVEAVELIGITWRDSRLVSFDPYTGEITDTHAQLNQNESYRGLVYDPNHNILYALAQGTNNLYSIDPMSLDVQHLGNLHIDKSLSSGEDAGALAYDPIENILYTAVEHWQWPGYTNIWSELCEINLSDLELLNIGDIIGPFISSFAFNEQDNQLYGLAVYGSGSWDSPYKSHVVNINPASGFLTEIFETPYHTVLGFAKKGGEDIYYSWINWTSHFYGEIDIGNHTITQLGNSDQVDVISAILYKDFYIESKPILPLEEIPVSFDFTGHVTEVYDPGNMLGGEINIGDNFSGHFSYDLNAPYKEGDTDPNLDAPYGVSVTVNGLTINSEGFYVGIQNNFYDFYDFGNVYDSFYFRNHWYSDTWIGFRLADNSASVLSNNNVLPNNFNLSSWDENFFEIVGCPMCEDFYYYISGVVDQIISDADGDGVPDDEDACPFSDLTETVVIDGCDSGVENVLLDDGCTISDLIWQCAEDAKNHGQFNNAVSHLLKPLKKDGTISGEEKGEIQICGEGADIP